ncbi:MAG: nuclear transport factor 2 family protein [Candidatus Heimdallarchaeota archaeon]|nr:nuclear transport factor 2 family protein [Candidatus Heimdallarchaeota archaeon]
MSKYRLIGDFLLRQTREGIQSAVIAFTFAIEKMVVDELLTYFADDCEISLLNVKLTGKEGAQKWLKWMFNHITKIKFEPIKTIIEGETHFEEFIVKAKTKEGSTIQSKQAKVLTFENYKIKNLRLYFDRLDFVNAAAGDFFSKKIIERVSKKSLEGLE